MRHRPFASLALGALVALVSLQPASARSAPKVFRIDPARSLAQFTVTKLGFANVTGTFRNMEGEIRWAPADPALSSVRWRVAVASVLTDARNRDETLQAPEYFDAARHPWLTFESIRVRDIEPGRLEVTGRLTMRGTTREVTVAVRQTESGSGPVFETAFDVDRFDYGIVGGRVMGRLIGRSVHITLKAVTEAAS